MGFARSADRVPGPPDPRSRQGGTSRATPIRPTTTSSTRCFDATAPHHALQEQRHRCVGHRRPAGLYRWARDLPRSSAHSRRSAVKHPSAAFVWSAVIDPRAALPLLYPACQLLGGALFIPLASSAGARNAAAGAGMLRHPRGLAGRRRGPRLVGRCGRRRTTTTVDFGARRRPDRCSADPVQRPSGEAPLGRRTPIRHRRRASSWLSPADALLTASSRQSDFTASWRFIAVNLQ